MLISQIILRDYGKFENLAVDFTPGLNLIKGPNEAGKSTLVGAMTAALFEDPSVDSAVLENSVKWGQEKGPCLEAVLNVDGKKYKLIKDFEKKTAKIEAADVAFPGGEKADINTWLRGELGIASDQVFQSTACVGQGKLNRIDDSIEAIKDKLESLATKGKEEQAASWAIEKLNQRIEYLGSGTPENGDLDSLGADLEYNIEKLERDMATLRGKRADLIQVETAYINVKEDLQERKRTLELAEKAAEASEKTDSIIAEINSLKNKIESAKEPAKKLAELKSNRSKLKRISKEELKQIEQMESSLNHLRPKLEELESETSEAEEDYKSYKMGGIGTYLSLLGFLGGVFSGVCYFTAIIPQVLLYFWYYAGGSVGLFILGMSILSSRRQHKKYLSNKFDKLSAKLETLKNEVASRDEKLSATLANNLSDTVDELRKSQWQSEELDGQIEAETLKYNKIMSGSTLDDLETNLARLENEYEELSAKGMEYSQYAVDSVELSRQRLAINEIEERVKDLERERTVLKQFLEMAEGGSELLASYLERRQRLELSRAELQHEMTVLKLSIECIEEAHQNVLVSKLEILNNRVSEILENLTGGRYSKVRFDKSTLGFQVWSNEKQGWVNPEKSLSAGTADQIYFAARLALADLISDEKNSILILDDPFANYDEKRLENAMKTLKGLTENHQIFLMTSHDHYDRWADSTVEL